MGTPSGFGAQSLDCKQASVLPFLLASKPKRLAVLRELTMVADSIGIPRVDVLACVLKVLVELALVALARRPVLGRTSRTMRSGRASRRKNIAM